MSTGHHRRIAVGLALWTWGALAGCAAPPAVGPRIVSGGGSLQPPALLATVLSESRRYHPQFGRLDARLCARHGILRDESAEDLPGAIFVADFEDIPDPAEIDWLVSGDPTLQVGYEAGPGRFLRIQSNPDAERSGVLKQLYAEPLAGRTLICQVRTRLSRARIVQAMGPPRVQFVVLLEGGREQMVEWPLVWRPSPAWETQRIWCTVPHGALAVRLDVLLTPAHALLDLDDVLICDAAALGATPATTVGAARIGPAAPRLAIDGPGDPASEGLHLVHLGRPAEFSWSVSGGDGATGGTMCLDITDALDRCVWTADVAVDGASETGAQGMHSLILPRGAYRLRTSLWSGEPEAGSLVATATQSFAVVNLEDAPTGVRGLGVTARAGDMTALLPRIGFSWVRLDGASGAGLEAAAGAAAGLGLSVVLPETGGPPPEPLPPGVFAEVSPERVDEHGGALWPSVVAAREELVPVLLGPREALWVPPSGGNVEAAIPALAARMASAPMGRPAVLGARTIGVPEDAEPLFESLASTAGDAASRPLWDTTLPLESCETAAELAEHVQRERRAGASGRVVGDPLLSASELVRAIVIRWWYGYERIGLEGAVSGGTGREGRTSLRYANGAARPVVAAIDHLAELLAEATPAEWVDGGQEARSVSWRRPDGSLVCMLWRPFGLAPGIYRLPNVPADVQWRNGFGQPEAIGREGAALAVPISGAVLFAVAPARSAGALQRAIDAALGQSAGKSAN